MTFRLIHGDCLEVMRQMAADGERFDAVVTDPPYHLTSIVKRFGKNGSVPAKEGATGAFARASRGFMGKTWDGGDVAFRPETWAAVSEVMKPGAYIVAFGSTRGYGRLQVAMEDAGFITHPMLAWIFGSGFPKATRVKAPGYNGVRYGLQALKPALEPIYLGQKPFSEPTGTANILKHGTGGLHVDACRVAMSSDDHERLSDWHEKYAGRDYAHNEVLGRFNEKQIRPPHAAGRWPPNLLHDGSPQVLEAFARFPADGAKKKGKPARSGTKRHVFGSYKGGTEIISPADDFGSPARFFPALGWSEDELRFMYCAKADSAERAGSKHPTIKPLSLMSWLAKLVCPPNGHILDPFAGSGSTLIAAEQLGFAATGIEMDAQSIAEAHERRRRLTARRMIGDAKPAPAPDPQQPGLFDP